jgi:uncharacterized repeat protein (TIGR01451 family)/fimbrial isopeptide formation D2 family protein
MLSDVHVQKTSDKTEFKPGDDVTYTITISNDGTAAAPNASMTDDLTQVLDDATFDGAASVQMTGTGASGSTVNYTAPNLTWNSPSLGAGKSVTLTYTVHTIKPGTGDKQLKNTVVVPDSNCMPGSTDPKCTPPPVKGPNVVFSKTADKQTAKPGDVVTYTITGTNNGAAPAHNVVYDDNLSQVLDDASIDPTKITITGPGALSYNEPTIEYTNPSMAVGDTVTITYSVTVTAPATGDKELKNSLVGNIGNCEGTMPATAGVAALALDPACEADVKESAIEVNKVADAQSPKLGDKVTYTWTIKNIGTAPALNVTSSDDMADVLDDADYNTDAQVASGPGQVNYTAPVFTYTAATLNPGEMATVTYSVTVKKQVAGNLLLNNKLTGYDNPPPSCTPEPGTTTLAANAACGEIKTPILPPPNLKVVKDTKTASAYAGKNLEYTVTYSNLPEGANTNPSDAHGVVVTETVPAHTTFVADKSDSRWTCTTDSTTTPASETCTAQIGDLPAGTSGTLAFTVKVDDGYDVKGEVENKVTITDDCASGCLDEPPYYIKKTPVGKIVLQKTAPTDPIAPGKNLTYTITAKNVGSGPVNDYVITDDFSDVLDDADYNNDPKYNMGSVDYQQPTLTWKGNIPAGETLTLTYSVKVKAAGSGNGFIVNSIVDPEVISNCMPNSSDPSCTSKVAVNLAATGDDALILGALGSLLLGGSAAGMWMWRRSHRRTAAIRS